MHHFYIVCDRNPRTWHTRILEGVNDRFAIGILPGSVVRFTVRYLFDQFSLFGFGHILGVPQRY